MARVSATVTKQTEKALESVQNTTRLPRAEILRIAIEEYLRKQGYNLDDKVSWGGNRKQTA